MTRPPELPTDQETKQIEKMIDADIDFQEHEHLRAVPLITEGLGEDTDFK